jgi:hypothetical protein
VANTLGLFRDGAVGFIDWLDQLYYNAPTFLPDLSWKYIYGPQ